jgi:hypothetical protein
MKRLILLTALLNSASVHAGIIDDDINLVCDYYLIAVTTTFKQDVQNRMRDDLQHKARITYDVVKLVEGQLAPRLTPQDRGSITDTEIAVGTYSSGYIKINRQSGVAVVSEWVALDKPSKFISRHSCTSHSRQVLDNIITRHNRAIKQSTSDRKF